MEKEETQTREQQIFGCYPVPKAVATMAIPTIVSQIITVIYNLADTWYVGLTRNAAAVAAVSLCLPVYNIMTAIANLYGIGGSSVIARSMGTGNYERAHRAYRAAFFGALITVTFYAGILLLFGKPFLLLIGGDDSSIQYAYGYTIVTMVIGGIPTVLSAVFAHLIRSTGKAKAASVGITIGAVLNMVLDPLFMFIILPKGNEVLGAAIATALSNTAALVYFLLYIHHLADERIFSFAQANGSQYPSVLPDVLKCGLPSFVLLGAGQISNFFLNGMIGEMGSSAAVAGMGVVRKIDSLAYSINQGITQGMLPIVAFCFSTHRFKRMKSVVFFSGGCTVCFSLVCSMVAYIFAPELITFFINDADTIYYGSYLLRIMCIAVAIYPMMFVVVAAFLAVGQSMKPFVLSLLHKGTLDIVLFFVIRKYFGLNYILWATPIMEGITLLISIVMFVGWLRTLNMEIAQEE